MIPTFVPYADLSKSLKKSQKTLSSGLWESRNRTGGSTFPVRAEAENDDQKLDEWKDGATGSELGKIYDILIEWRDHGETIHPGYEGEEKAMPLHPEFVYRRAGEWRGWNDFLGVKESDPAFGENQAQDRLEARAWSLYLKKSLPSGGKDASSTIDPILSLRGLGKSVWAGEEADSVHPSG